MGAQPILVCHVCILRRICPLDNGKALDVLRTPLQTGHTMASNLIAKASKELRRINDSKKLERIKDGFKSQEVQTAGGAAFGTVAAALADKKWGEGGEVAKVKSVPVNLVLGAAIFGGALMAKKLPARNIIGGAGLGQGLAGLYRAVYDNVDFDGQDQS